MKISRISNVYKQQPLKNPNRIVEQNNATISFSASDKKYSVTIPAFVTAISLIASSEIATEIKQNNEKNNNAPKINVEETVEPIIEESISPEEILETHPKIKEQYKKIIDSLNTFSEQLGEDALPVIEQKIKEIGEGKVETIDVLKILCIESNGRIYGKDGKILVSSAKAYGPFQITQKTADYLKDYYEVDFDIKNPYGNIEGCIYNLKFLHDKRSRDLREGEKLPTGDNLKHAIVWSYHDGAWADNVSAYGKDYIAKFRVLSQIDRFPELIDYILNSGE